MKVLIIPSWYPTENKPNSGIFFKEQSISLQEFGHEVTVAYPEIHSLREFFKPTFKRGLFCKFEAGIKTYRFKEYNLLRFLKIGSGIIYYLRLKHIFKRILRREGIPEIIHAHSALWGGWAAARISRKYKIPLVITEHSSSFVRGTIQKYQIPYIKKAFRQSKKVIVVGPTLKNELEKFVEPDKLEIIPNTFNKELFRPKESINEERKECKFHFFSLAFLSRNKGFDILLRAYARAFKGNKNVELIIGGDGEEKTSLEILAKDLEINEQVSFLGELSRENAAKEMQKCDVFVLASRFETFGVVLIEALACGKPIISTRCGGPEIIVNNRNGILVEVDNIEKLSEALKQLKANYTKYDKEFIYSHCHKNFGKEAIIKKINHLYKYVSQP